jgi:hypothetical protein
MSSLLVRGRAEVATAPMSLCVDELPCELADACSSTSRAASTSATSAWLTSTGALRSGRLSRPTPVPNQPLTVDTGSSAPDAPLATAAPSAEAPFPPPAA